MRHVFKGRIVATGSGVRTWSGTWMLAALLATLLATPALAQTPPPNDEAATAEVMSGAGPFPVISTTVDVTNATTTNDPPTPLCFPGGAFFARSVWYRFTPAATGRYAFSTLTSETSTTVSTGSAAYTSTGGAAGPFTQIACSDAGRVNAVLTAGIEVWLAVWQDDIPPQPSGNVQVWVFELPANDEIDGAEVIPGAGPFPYTTAVIDTDLASTATTDPASTCTSTFRQRSVWYKFTPAAGGVYSFFCSEDGPSRTNVSDTVVAVYESSGGPSPTLTDRGCNDDGGNDPTLHAILAGVTLTGGTEYYVVVWRDTGAVSTPAQGETLVQLVVSRVSNDTAATAIPLILGSAQVGYLAGATNDYELPASPPAQGTFSANTAVGRDVVYTFTAPFQGGYTFRISDMRDNRPIIYLARALPTGTPPQPVALNDLVIVANRGTASQGEQLTNIQLNASEQVFVVVDSTAVGTAAIENTSFKVEVEIAGPLEGEPNNTPAQATPIAQGITGSLLTANEPDFFALGAPITGSRVFAMVDAGQMDGTGRDCTLRVTTSTDTLEYDDDDNDVQFGSTASNVAGTPLTGVDAFLRVSMLSATLVSEPYRVFHAIQPPSAMAIAEVEPNDTIATATSSGFYFSGALAAAASGPSTDADLFAFQAQADDIVFVSADGFPGRGAAGTPAASTEVAIELLDAMGNLLQRASNANVLEDTASGAGNLAALSPDSPADALIFRARATGTYYARVFRGGTSATDTVGPYLLSIALIEPGILRATGTLTTFQTTAVNLPSAEQSYSLLGLALRGDVTITAPASFEISLASGAGFASQIVLPQTGGQVGPVTIFVRYNPQTPPGPHGGSLVHTAQGAMPLNLQLHGDLILTPTITITGGSALALFRAPAINSPSSEQSYQVSAVNLSGNVTVTAPTHFEVATAAAGPYQSTLTLTPAGGAVASTTIFARYRPTTPGSHQDDILHSSAGATTRSVNVAGVIPSLLTYAGVVPSGGLDIPDGGAGTSLVTSSVTVVQQGVVLGVRVKNLTILHTDVTDLDIALIGPNNVRIDLSSDNGGSSNDNYLGTTFDDAAATSIVSATAPMTGTFSPEQPLSTFQNTSAAGTWTLELDDDTSSDDGKLIKWELEIETTSGPATAAPSIVVSEPPFGGVPIENGGPVANLRDFGETGIAAPSTSLPITIRNPGTATLTVTPQANGGTGAAQFVSTLAAQQIPAGGSATFNVTFAPNVVGVHTADIVFIHDATAVTASPFKIAVRGEGVPGTVLTQSSVDVPKNIPDNAAAGVTSTLTVPAPVGGAGRFIVDVNVKLTILHTDGADLDIFLVSPQNTQIELSTDNGRTSAATATGGDHFIDTVFDDQASVPITDASSFAPYTGSFRPEQVLGTLFTQNAVGTWTLRVVDDASVDVGSIVSWSLEVVYSTQAPALFEVVDLSTNQVVPAKGATGAVPLDFGFVGVGAPVTRQFRIRNAGLAASSMTVQTPVAVPATEFDVSTGLGSFPANLAGGQDRTFDVVFDPQAPGTLAAEIAVSHTAANLSSPFIFDVTGRGVAFAPFTVAATGLPIALNDPPSTASPPARTQAAVTVATNGLLEFVLVRNLDITHDFLEDLTISLVHPDGTVVPLATKRGAGYDNLSQVTFDDGAVTAIATATPSTTPPAFTGAFKPEGSLASLRGKNTAGTWRLRIDDDFGPGPVGTGTLDRFELFLVISGPPIVPQIELRHGALGGPIVNPGGTVSFGPVTTGTQARTSIVVRNPGTALLTVNGVSLTSNPSNVFALAGTTSFTVAASGGVQVFDITFNPAAVATFQGSVRVTHTGSGTASPLDFNITGSGVTSGGGGGGSGILTVSEGAASVASGATFDFGAQATAGGPTGPRVLTLRNTGTVAIGSILATVSGTNAGDFTITQLPAQLAPNGVASLEIRFDPSADGARAAVLTIAHNATGSPFVLNVSGTGTGSGTTTPPPTQSPGFTLGRSSGGGGGGCYMHDGKGGGDLFFPVLLVVASFAIAVRRLRARAVGSAPAMDI